MIPAILIAVLSVARLGAIYVIVFGGFASKSLAQRIEVSRARVVLTASCAVEGPKDCLHIALWWKQQLP